MTHFRKLICLVLTFCTVLGTCIIPANASDDPLSVKDYDQFGAPYAPGQETEQEAPPEETLPPVTPGEEEPAQTEPVAETQPATEPVQETEPEETVAEETIPEETVPEETIPEETVPEETEPEEEEGKPVGHNGVPLYFQTDYPNNMFGVGTIASNGCSIVSLAMVATYMTGHEYKPDELARYFGGAAESNIARLEQGSEALQLPFWKSENFHKTMEALRSGKIAIVLMGSDSIFTQSQHFIILTGITEDGRILVNDSYEPNYYHWRLKNGFREGFTEGDILLGYSGAWIYDKDALPEEPFIYSEPLPVRGEPRYDIQLTLEERKLLAKVIWVEARGECEEGQQAVAEVVFNRMASEKFPNILRNVIFAEGQFRSADFLDDAEPYQAQYEAIENALYGPYVLPEDVFYFATAPKTDRIWGSIGGHIFCYAED